MPDANASSGGRILIFAPQQTQASATLLLTTAPDMVAFDAQGNLYVVTVAVSGQGAATFNYEIYEYAPGNPAPVKVITPPPAGGTGDFFAVSPQGAFAVAIVGTSPGTIYPPVASSSPYAISAQPFYDDLAFSPSGEVAIGSGTNIITYPLASTTPNRTLTFPSGLLAGSLAYDGLGNLAVGLYSNPGPGTPSTYIFAPGASVPTYTIPNVVGQLLFDAKNELVVASPISGQSGQTISFYQPGATSLSRSINTNIAFAITIDSAGDIAGILPSNTMAFPNTVEVLQSNGTTTTLSGFSNLRNPAFSP